MENTIGYLAMALKYCLKHSTEFEKQSALADKIGVSTATISNATRGETKSMELWRRISMAFGYSLEDFILLGKQLTDQKTGGVTEELQRYNEKKFINIGPLNSTEANLVLMFRRLSEPDQDLFYKSLNSFYIRIIEDGE